MNMHLLHSLLRNVDQRIRTQHLYPHLGHQQELYAHTTAPRGIRNDAESMERTDEEEPFEEPSGSEANSK